MKEAFTTGIDFARVVTDLNGGRNLTLDDITTLEKLLAENREFIEERLREASVLPRTSEQIRLNTVAERATGKQGYTPNELMRIIGLFLHRQKGIETLDTRAGTREREELGPWDLLLTPVPLTDKGYSRTKEKRPKEPPLSPKPPLSRHPLIHLPTYVLGLTLLGLGSWHYDLPFKQNEPAWITTPTDHHTTQTDIPTSPLEEPLMIGQGNELDRIPSGTDPLRLNESREDSLAAILHTSYKPWAGNIIRKTTLCRGLADNNYFIVWRYSLLGKGDYLTIRKERQLEDGTRIVTALHTYERKTARKPTYRDYFSIFFHEKDSPIRVDYTEEIVEKYYFRTLKPRKDTAPLPPKSPYSSHLKLTLHQARRSCGDSLVLF